MELDPKSMDRDLCIVLIVLRFVHKFVCYFVPCDQDFRTRRSVLSNCSCMLLFLKKYPPVTDPVRSY